MNNILNEDFELLYNNDLNWNEFKNCSFLITGASGMIGSYIIQFLMYLNKIYDLNIQLFVHGRNYDKIFLKYKQFYSHENFFIMDNPLEKRIDLYGELNYIIHAASPSNSQLYKNNPLNVYTPNVIGTENLLKLAKEKNVKGFIYLSSGEVNGYVDKEIITENDYGYIDPTDIRNIYGESKRMGEALCKCYNQQYNISTYCVRLVHTYGPTIDLRTDKRVFSEFITNIIKNENIVLKSDGLSTRNFCYISDAIDGIFRVLLKGKSGESYNIGSGEKISIKDLAQTLIDLFPEKNLKIVFEKQDENYLECKIKDYPIYSIDKIKQLGYKPKINIKNGFLRTIKGLAKC